MDYCTEYCDATAVAARLVKPLRAMIKEREKKKKIKNNHENGERGLRTHAPSGAIHWGFLRADDILGADRGCSRDGWMRPK
jgi:hypothetical protein